MPISPFAVGLGAGFAAALLFATVATGAPLALLLSYIAPLPILIVSLGWDHRAGLVSSAFGAALIVLLFGPVASLGFLTAVALPGWALGWATQYHATISEGSRVWLPVGGLLFLVSLISAIMTLGGVLSIGESYADYVSTVRLVLEGVLQQSNFNLRLEGLSTSEIATRLVPFVPLMAGVALACVLTGNLWLGAKIVHLSQRLPRPWPDLSHIHLPRLAAFVFAGSIAGSLTLTGYASVLALALTGALLTTFSLQGLAALHTGTHGFSGRVPLLILIYVMLTLFSTFLMPLLALGGVVHCLLRRPSSVA